MTAREAEVAAEIRRLARAHVSRAAEFGDEEELASRLDSLQILALVTAVEDRFQVILAPDDAAQTRSLVDLARLVAARVEAGRVDTQTPETTPMTRGPKPRTAS